MTRHDLFKLYNKEREYEKQAFGDYDKIPSLNFASFILFLDLYVKRAKTAYGLKWESKLPEWLITSREFEENGSAPVTAYEEVIKIMALAGAALETFASIDPNRWREDIESQINKWKE